MAMHSLFRALVLALVGLSAASCAQGVPGFGPIPSGTGGSSDSGALDGALLGVGGTTGTGGLDTTGTGGLGTGGVGTGGLGTGGVPGTGGLGTGGITGTGGMTGAGGGATKPACDASKCAMPALGMACCKTDGTCGSMIFGLPCG